VVSFIARHSRRARSAVSASTRPSTCCRRRCSAQDRSCWASCSRRCCRAAPAARRHPAAKHRLFFGGVAETEVILSFVILIATALLFSTLGIFFSSRSRRTLSASVLTYTTATFFTFGLPIMIGGVLVMFGFSINNVQSSTSQIAILYVLGAVICTKPGSDRPANAICAAQPTNHRPVLVYTIGRRDCHADLALDSLHGAVPRPDRDLLCAVGPAREHNRELMFWRDRAGRGTIQVSRTPVGWPNGARPGDDSEAAMTTR